MHEAEISPGNVLVNFLGCKNKEWYTVIVIDKFYARDSWTVMRPDGALVVSRSRKFRRIDDSGTSPETKMNNVREFLRIANKIDVIVNDRDLTWDDKYDLIFSDNISCRIFGIDPMREYFDPDTSYEEDVLAFAEAVRRRATELESCLD